MVLIDRTPPGERHVGASANWDRTEFRLRMAQSRMEKRLAMSEHLSGEVRKMIRRDLAAIHSGWANWFVQNKEYKNASNAVAAAARIHLTMGIAVKWALSRAAPPLARKIAELREEHRSRRAFGIG